MKRLVLVPSPAVGCVWRLDMGSQALSAGLRWAVAAGLVLSLVLGLTAAPAGAEEEGAKTIKVRVTEYVRQLTTLRKSEDVYRIHDQVWQGPDLYKEAERDDSRVVLQAKLVKGIGKLCRHRDERVRLCAIEALGVMKHEDGATYLKPFLKEYKEKPASEITIAAIDSAGSIADKSLAGPLLKFVASCPCPGGIRHAVQALGGFGKVKGEREKILVALLQTTLDEEDFDRWKVLKDSVPSSLDRLTSRDVGTLDGWNDLVEANLNDLSVLFPKEEKPREG